VGPTCSLNVRLRMRDLTIMRVRDSEAIEVIDCPTLRTVKYVRVCIDLIVPVGVECDSDEEKFDGK
jgi:hypothetical protein